MKYKIVSIDLAKNVFQVCGMDQDNAIRLNKKVTRAKFLDSLRQLDCEVVVMEACYSSNPWGRAIAALGHNVKLIPPHQVKPFLVGNKNDHNDAIAIAEASQRPKARFVAVKTLEQQDLQSLDRIRDRQIRHRTAISNQLRGLLSEYGIAVPLGLHKLAVKIPDVLEDATNELTVVARAFISDLFSEMTQMSSKIQSIENTIASLVRNNPDHKRLMTIRGVGPVIATAIISSIGDARQYKNGRSLAAWMGLTPKQHSSGDNSTMGAISKRGNAHLRRLLIHGARSVINWCDTKTDKLSLWVKGLLSRMHPCKAIVALANKMARIIWAVLAKKTEYTAELM